MGFWKTLGKIGAIAAPIVAAPFTGGASLALIGAGAGAAGGALSGGGWKGALTGAALGGATAGLAGGGAGSAAGKGIGAGLKQAVIGSGSKLAQLGTGITNGMKVMGAAGGSPSAQPGGPYATPPIAGTDSNSMGRNISDWGSKLGGLASGIDSALHNGVDPVTRGRQAGSTESILKQDRYRDASMTPAAVGADHQAFSNMMRASNIASYQPNPHAVELWSKWGQHALTPSPEAMQFATTMRDQLQKRATAGQPLTMSGAAAASPEEIAAHKQATQLASGSPGGVLGAVQTGANFAKLIPQVAGMFAKQSGGGDSKPFSFVGPMQEDDADYGDDGNSYYGG